MQVWEFSHVLLDRGDPVAGNVLVPRLGGQTHVHAVGLVIDADSRVLGVPQIAQ